MSGLQAYRLLFRRGLTPVEQIERNVAIIVLNCKIIIGCYAVVIGLTLWRLAR